MDSTSVLEINVDSVIHKRMPGLYRFLPHILVKKLEALICQDELNSILRYSKGKTGSEFCRCCLDYLDVSYKTYGSERLPAPEDSRVIYVSNHPLGGLDGISLICMVAALHGKEPYFVVNDLLMNIEPLRSVFLPINKHGRQGRMAADSFDAAFESDRPVIIFPAGLVSRKQPDGSIADLDWKTTFVNRAIKSNRDIIPLYFDGRNSDKFYNFARMRKKLHVKFNFDMLLLPREVMWSRGKEFGIHVGPRVFSSKLRGGACARAESLAIRKIVYNLSR